MQAYQDYPDFVTNLDYDGNFETGDNWDNLYSYRNVLRSQIYFAVSESSTHWFIFYGFYHPRDWAPGVAGQQHENDFESLFAFVRKNGTTYGQLEGMVVQAHGDNIPYRAPGVPISQGFGSPHALRTLILAPTQSGETHQRPWTYQEPGGHGLFSCGENLTHDLRHCEWLTDIVKYLPSRSSSGYGLAPPSGGVRSINYVLIDLNAPRGLFERRYNSETFADYDSPYDYYSHGRRTLHGNHSDSCSLSPDWCIDDAAIAPWGENDEADALPPLVFGKDPARLLRDYYNFGALSDPSSLYVRNDFGAGGNLCLWSRHPLEDDANYSSGCVKDICAVDPFCCSNHWDSVCVSEVASVCGASCNTCAHATSVTGAALARGCSPCVAEVCNARPSCCTSSWTSTCVSDAAGCSDGHFDVRYDVHQKDYGWIEDSCADGQHCGYTKESRRLEAIRVFDPISGGGVCYQVYAQGLGWMTETCTSGAIAGTIGQGRRLEAVKIRLENAPAQRHVCYQVHMAGLGWGAEACDGAIAGTTGQSRQIESLAVRIKVY